MYKTLIVVDDETLPQEVQHLEVISFDTYLANYPKRNEPKTRIINLCDTEHYLSKGYYCSLLAEARDHGALPSVKTINELRTLKTEPEVHLELGLSSEARELAGSELEEMVYFGQSDHPAMKKLAKKLFSRYPAPILRVSAGQRDGKPVVRVERCSPADLSDLQRSQFYARLVEFTKTVWRVRSARKSHRWEMAILVDPQEKVPPSNKEAINRFVKAAAKHGIRAEVVSADELQHINNYDALFIRETTAIDHHTYRLASKAEANGLVVMDDPASILRCCNKVYLHDAFSYQNVPSLKTLVVTAGDPSTLERIEQSFTYPLVLKMPEGSFSRGVFKVKSRKELQERLDELFQESALVLAQEYLYTEYDWRIGVLNGRVIYACRYLMARNHWQIYHHKGNRAISGGFETLPTFEVPKVVLDSALKAARIVGNGLYGVDIKQHENQAYVIEVNDNPSIDHKVEDEYVGDELYMQIMAEFQQRLERRGR
jgi:glutathione synthase/RimK-type ligase-like ATP-grasp enzyme